MSQLDIFYVRHADTVNTFDDRDKSDVNLSELGEKQIKLLGERFKGKSFDAVFSSPMVRAVKTAAAVCEQLDGHPQLEILPQLVENKTTRKYFGTGEEYLKKYYDNIIVNHDMPLFFRNVRDIDNDIRCKKIIKYLKERFTYGQKIIIFAHGSLGNHFIPKAVGMPHGNYVLSLNHTGVTKIKYTPDGKQRISFMNDISHLRPLMENYEFDL